MSPAEAKKQKTVEKQKSKEAEKQGKENKQTSKKQKFRTAKKQRAEKQGKKTEKHGHRNPTKKCPKRKATNAQEGKHILFCLFFLVILDEVWTRS